MSLKNKLKRMKNHLNVPEAEKKPASSQLSVRIFKSHLEKNGRHSE